MAKVKRLKAEPLIHLHNHSEYSFLDAIIKIKGLGARLRAKGYRSYALTDHGNVNGIYAFVTELKKAGVKPIVGCEFYIVPKRTRKGLTDEERSHYSEGLKGKDAKQAIKEAEKTLGIRERSHVVCLAKNNAGWRKMIRALELAYSEGFYYFPRIDYELLRDMAPDIVVMTACLGGVPGRLISKGEFDNAVEWCDDMADTFGDDFFIEIQPNDIDAQVKMNPELVRLAQTVGVPLVATNDVHYLEPEDWQTHDSLLALRESQHGKTVLVTDPERFKYPTNQLYLKSRAEMELSFTKFHPELDPEVWKQALDNTLAIDSVIEPDIIEVRKAVLPKLNIEAEYGGSPDKKLWGLVRNGWVWRKVKQRSEGKTGVINWVDGEPPREAPLFEVCAERVKYEMREITRLGFSRYFLVIWDLIGWAREEGIRVGPGRGSVGGSYVAYLLGITSVDSVRFGCPFSRFISPDRIDYPDIDIDFPTVERSRIKKYLIDKYGAENVAGICTFGKMKGRLVLKDVGRVHNVPWQKTESVTKLVVARADADERADNTLEDTFANFSETQWYKKAYPIVVKHAQRLEGNVRHLGVHAAGMVISDEPLRNLVPVQYQRDRSKKEGGLGEYLTGWDKRQVEAVGLLKLDILGIEGLTYIQRTLDLIKERYGETVEPEDWTDFDDALVWENFQQGNTELVWQMNTFNTIRVLRRLKPTKFDHLVATTSLIRPGPMNAGITDDYIARRHGKKAKGVHPVIDSLLSETLGLFVYQENVIQVVHDIGGFSWGEADRIRKDIGKKKGVEYLRKTYLDRFVDGAQQHGIDPAKAKHIWGQISEFGLYGFNRAHATGYSLLSYWTMYLKLHYPLEFMTAALEAETDSTKRHRYIKEAKRLGINVMPPDANASGFSFTIDDKLPMTIRCGLTDVKGVAKKSAQSIIDGQPYDDLLDFLLRSGANKTAVRAFLRIGALDTLVKNPKRIDENLDAVLKVKKLKRFEKYWGELVLNPSKNFTLDERSKYQLELVSLPPAIHPAIKAVEWLTERCPHITFNRIEDFESLFDGEFSSIHRAFIGVCTKAKLYEDSGHTPRETPEGEGSESPRKTFQNQLARINIEDETGALTARTSVAQLNRLGASNVKEGSLFVVIGHSIGFYKVGCGAIVNLTDLMQGVELGKEYEAGTPEHFILTDAFAPYRKFIRTRESLLPFDKGKRSFRTVVNILGVDHKLTKKKQRMLIVCCQDWKGEIRDVVLWPSDYQVYNRFFEVGKLMLLRLKSKVEGGRTRRYFLNTTSGVSPVMSLDKYYTHHTEGKK